MNADVENLIDVMSWVSQCNWAASWMEGTEYALWNALHDRKPTWGYIGDDEIAALREAFDKAKMWVMMKPSKEILELLNTKDTGSYWMSNVLTIPEWEAHSMEELL